MQQLINAAALAAIYALLATAYSLIYGLVGRINLAFGEIAVLGAYGAIGGVACLLLLAATAACYVPARWAARLDPTEALRHE